MLYNPTVHEILHHLCIYSTYFCVYGVSWRGSGSVVAADCPHWCVDVDEVQEFAFNLSVFKPFTDKQASK